MIRTDDEDGTRKQSGLEDTEECSQRRQGSPVVDETHAQDTASPGDDEKAQPVPSANASNNIVGGQFKQSVPREEYQKCNVVASSNSKLEVLSESSNIGS